MTIETVCPQCGKSYRVRDKMAGKRFRCKACQAAVNIPVASSDDDAGNDDWDDDFLGGLDTAVKSERRAPAGGPPPIARRSGHRSSAASKKSTRSKSNEATGSVLKLLVGLVSGAVGLVVGYLVVTALMSGGSAPAWTGFTSPDGTYQVEFPAAPQLKSFPAAAPESKRYVGETSQLGAAVSASPLPPDAANGASPQALEKVAEQNAQQRPGTTLGDKRPLTFGKHPALEYTLTTQVGDKQLAETTRIVLTDKAVYTLEFVADGPDHAADRDRFFNSFGLLGDVTADWNDSAASP